MFQPLFDATDPTFRALASDHKAPTVEPLPISPWVAMSAMQKGIRRGDVELALSAAMTLLRSDPAKLWRRLAGIAVEDVGLANLDCVALVFAGTLGKTFRQSFGGEWAVASLLVKQACLSRKCRAADDLLIALSHHHELDDLRSTLAREDLSEHLSRIEGRGALLGASLAALHASGVRWTGQAASQKADPKALFATIRSAGIDHEITGLAEQGWRRTREALPVLLPLLTLALPFGKLPVQDDELPYIVTTRSGLPTYCYDGFSREGLTTLARFLKRDTTTGRWFRKHVPAQYRVGVLHGAVFRVEGGLVRQRVQWPCAVTLRRLADSGYHGMKLPDPDALLDMIRDDLPVLDEERADVQS
ncbi:hypothetical protein EN817_25150 [Mesorhizobium sp. M3A.F.Ca.ET.174.01.1.1]|uniref:hypothetical protein n=1 Tax=unclassified Mesorhizobium TaxID=325217 RepID=UPI001093D149|nr:MULTISPECIES: hypothetical protein [unclassified Mesorhizobium]TGS82731.1 hypothetical protein EN818_25200 [Mesorhizobium sp. M3A.F.Ca.ET.175.01.1.1]TGT22686.1 hypothetical protein EN817_25150 [Mesorhizobium sp. M3A.F.Ca.ET.174.01.1.1]